MIQEEANILDEIDRYLDAEMDAGEQARFAQRLREDPELDQKVIEQRYFRELYLGGMDRSWIGRSLKSLKEKAENLGPDSSIRLPIHRDSSLLGWRFWASLGAAASLALLITLGGYWYSSRLFLRQNKGGYVDLRRAIDNIRKSQTALINDIHQHSSVPLDPGTFGGSGFAISTNGYIATNYHVVHNADSIYIEDFRGNMFKTNVVYQDPVRDLAILKVKADNFSLPPLPYTLKTHAGELGEPVFTLGYPKDDIVYGEGYISSRTGFQGDTTAFQLSIPVNPGNSGGPLLDSAGNLLGIISGKQGQSEDITFAVKGDYLKSMLDSLPVSFHPHALLNPRNNLTLSHMDRVDQLKKLQDFVFQVKVYN